MQHDFLLVVYSKCKHMSISTIMKHYHLLNMLRLVHQPRYAFCCNSDK